MKNCDKDACQRLRKQIYLTIEKGGMGHLASSFSCLEILYTLYVKGVMQFDTQNIKDKGRDRFVLSKGHAGMALYQVMCEVGLLDKREIDTYLQMGSHIGGEPCMRDLECVEASTGSLGHGLSMAVGMAIAQKLDHIDARTFAVIGDGECQEGTIWEAAMSAPVYELDNLVVILDCNKIQKNSLVKETMKLDNWKEKWESFGWLVQEVDGHDIDALELLLRARNNTGKPLLVIAHTIKGKGVSIMENNPLWHFKLPNSNERKVFAEELGISKEEMA